MPALVQDTNPRFSRRTSLESDEYRKNFLQIDRDVLKVLLSDEARRVSSLMPRIYLAIIMAPPELFEREGVLRLTGFGRRKGRDTAWTYLCGLAGVSNSTLSKCLAWLHEAGVIGYSAFSNGAGIRIFLNRASNSIGKRVTRTPSRSVPTPPNGAAFKEVRIQEDLECINTPAPDGATQHTGGTPPLSYDQVAGILRQAANDMANAYSRETAKTREWFERAAIPKAIRIAQAETFSVLRAHTKGTLPLEKKKPTTMSPEHPPQVFSHEQIAQTWIELAEFGRDKPVKDLLREYVIDGRMTRDEALSILRDCEAFKAAHPENSC